MYYILNQNHHIVAADSHLLHLLHVDNIDELYSKIALGEIIFSSPLAEEIYISVNDTKELFSAQNHTLKSILGNMILVEIEATQKQNAINIDMPEEDLLVFNTSDTISIIEEETPLILKDSTMQDLSHDAHEEALVQKKSIHEDTLSIHEEEFLSTDEVAQSTQKESIQTQEPRTDFLDLILPDTTEETTHELIETPHPISSNKEKIVSKKEKNTDPIVIDIQTISQQIGISIDDYNTFLTEYLDTALSLKEELKSEDKSKYSHAIDTLSNLSSILYLSMITEIITEIETSFADDKHKHIESLYHALDRLTTTQIMSKEENTSPEQIDNLENISYQSFGKIDLSNINPIHFDFQIGKAASDLSLPVELIEEFVHDFIEQAHTETKKMLTFYEKGDLDAIQKIGHMLKGASSNLRINALSETLYKIQFCEDASQLEDFIKDYWGHFLSFETQIKLTSK